MLNKIIKYSISHKLVIGLLTLALILAGIYSLKQLPVDAVPDTPVIAKPAATTEFNADVPTTPVSLTLASPVTFASLPNVVVPASPVTATDTEVAPQKSSPQPARPQPVAT
mgnify:CR=1 FL=1